MAKSKARARVGSEGVRDAMHGQAQRRQMGARGDLVALFHDREHVRLLDGRIEGGLVRPDVDLRAQAEETNLFYKMQRQLPGEKSRGERF